MIRCSVQGQELIVGSPVIAADSINYLTAEFIFRTSDWDGLTKIAHFSNGEKSADIELIDDRILSSAGLNLSEGCWVVSLTGHAYDGGILVQRITTTQAKLIVKPSAVPDGEPIESLPSYGEQILGAVEEINEKLDSFTAEAETLPEGSEATASYDGQHFSFGIPTGPKGDTGVNGADGFSPSAMVSKSGRTTTITITDKNRTTTANVFDGTNGRNGVDGFSPTATVEKVGNASTITITDKNGTTTATVYDDAELRDEVAGLKDSVDNERIVKLNRPISDSHQPFDGEEGQVLQSNGDGTTTWAYIGTPTPEQTQEAVDSWLDRHPDKVTTVTDALELPANNEIIKCVRGLAQSDYQIVSVMPYKSSGYTGVSLAHTQENLINPPYNSIPASYYGLNVDIKYSENKVIISGDKTVAYWANLIFVANIEADAGRYILCGASNCKITSSAPGSKTAVLRINDNGDVVQTGNLVDNPILVYEMAQDSTTLGASLNFYGVYTCHGEIYPLFGRGEKIDKNFETTIYGGTYNWTTGELVSLYDASGNRLYSPVVSNIGGVDIDYYDAENWFYSNSGMLNIEKPVTLGEQLNNISDRIYIETLIEMRAALLSVGSVINTLGYYEAGDGGGAVYKIRSRNNSDSDNGKDIIILNNGLVAEMIVPDNGVINIKTFGAKSNGTTDCTSAFNYALEKYSSIIVPNGEYVLSSPVEISENKSVYIDNSAIIKPAGNNGLFIMRTGSILEGGMLNVYRDDYTESAIIIQPQSTNTYLYNATVKNIYILGAGCVGTGIYLKRATSPNKTTCPIGCHIDNVRTRGLKTVVKSDETSGTHINITSNYDRFVIEGSYGACCIDVTGEVGLLVEDSDCAVEGQFFYCDIHNGMIDIGGTGHIKYGIHLLKNSTQNVVSGISVSNSIVDDGQGNYIPFKYPNNKSRTGITIRDRVYNNALDCIEKRYPISITLSNCHGNASPFPTNVFLRSISSMNPQVDWGFTADDIAMESSVTIEISNINMYPTELSYEWRKTVGGNYGLCFENIELWGQKNDSAEYEIIGEIKVDKTKYASYQLGPIFNWETNYYEYNSNVTPLYKNIKIVLRFQAASDMVKVAYITALSLVGKYADSHMTFVQSVGGNIYGDLIFDAGKSVVLESPNGTAYRIKVANDGTISSEIVT